LTDAPIAHTIWPMTKPQQVPDAIADLERDINSTLIGTHITSELARWIIPTKEAELSLKDRAESARAYWGVISESINKSSLYYCDEDMTAVVHAGAATLDNTDLADAQTVPSPEGFCYFDGGILVDGGGVVHGLAWRQLDQDTSIVMVFNDSLKGPDRSSEWQAEKILENAGVLVNFRWGFTSMQFYTTGEPLNPLVNLSSEKIEKTYGEGGIPEKIITSKIFHSFLLMLQQPAELLEARPFKSKTKKAIKRAKKNKVSDTVTVLDLRHKRPRSSSPTIAGGSIDYSVRWLVSGHWRWQPFKHPETREWIKKRIWIDSYVKGPEDKPFVANKVVRALLK
jgi:hypothetical protein